VIAVLASGSGALLAWAPIAAELPAPPAHSVIRELEAWDAPPPLPYVWSPTHIDWVVPAGAPKPLLTQLEFMARWRAAGLGAVLTMVFSLEVKDSPTGAAAREWLTEFRSARGIDPGDFNTVSSTTGVLAMAVASGVVTQTAAEDGLPIVLAPL
jgi:hypothetical protein